MEVTKFKKFIWKKLEDDFVIMDYGEYQALVTANGNWTVFLDYHSVGSGYCEDIEKAKKQVEDKIVELIKKMYFEQ